MNASGETPPDEVKFPVEFLEYQTYVGACWGAAVHIAEQLISRKSSDPADEDVRQSHVFGLASMFFEKMCLSYGQWSMLRLAGGG